MTRTATSTNITTTNRTSAITFHDSLFGLLGKLKEVEEAKQRLIGHSSFSIRGLFEAIDVNHNGKCYLEDFTKFMSEIGIQHISENELTDLYAESKQSRNVYFGYEDLVTLITPRDPSLSRKIDDLKNGRARAVSSEVHSMTARVFETILEYDRTLKEVKTGLSK